MQDCRQYLRVGAQWMRPYVPGEDLTGVMVSFWDVPQEGGMLVMNPDNMEDVRYMPEAEFQQNYRPVIYPPPPPMPMGSGMSCVEVANHHLKGKIG